MIIKEQQINEQIRDKQVRLIGEDGEQLGIMSSKDAYVMAVEKQLDLVKISPNSTPPVCKIMDFGKYRYELAKKEKESKKKQKVMSVKEIRLRPAIDTHDLNTKANMAIKFLSGGDKVKISVRYRGRELGHKELGFEVMDDFLKIIAEYVSPPSKPKMEGNSLVLTVEPIKK